VSYELWRQIPPDSDLVLYFGCGDGSGAEALRQRYPQMTLLTVEYDDALRSQAKRHGFEVLNAAAAALERINQLNRPVNAWIVERRAWKDETLTSMLRNEFFKRLQPGATVVWDIGNNQYWRHVLRVIAGKAVGEVRYNPEEILREFERNGVTQIDQVTKSATEVQDFAAFWELQKPIIRVLGLPLAEWEQKMKIEGVVLRGRYRIEASVPVYITAILGESQVCSRVRLEEPHAFLATLPQVQCRQYSLQEEARLFGEGKLIWIWQRLLIPREQLLPMQKKRIDHRVLPIQEWDDDPLNWSAHFQKTDFFEFRSAHGIQTSTPALAEYFRQYNPEVIVFPNCIDSLPPLQHKISGPIKIFFGALNRQNEWKPIMPALNRILGKMGTRVELIVLWDREFFDAVCCGQKQFEPFCAYPRYQELLRQSDICLLPLLPARFNRMKSDLKFVESAALGAVALASPTVYADSLRHGETGLLYETEAEFENNLTMLIENAALRTSLSENAWEWVKENRLLSTHYRERLDWYHSLYSRYDEITEAIKDRVPELKAYKG